MRKLLVASVLLLLGCEATSPTDAILITTSASASSVPVRGTVSLTFTVYNRSDEEIRVAAGGCERMFEVLNANGDIIGPAQPQVCALDLVAPTIVAPGASTTITTTWSGDAAPGPADQATYVPPGSYSVRPKLMVLDAGFVYGTAIQITVTQ